LDDAITLLLADLGATTRLAAWLGSVIEAGDVIALRGTLGAGKTELARALLRARAGAMIEVPSPSFTLVQDYDLFGLLIRHIDLYRIEDVTDLRELGLDSVPDDGEAWLVEWPERLNGRAGAWLEIDLAQGPKPDARIVRLTASPTWTARLASLKSDPMLGAMVDERTVG
jgi:tRNA threonylcarbamoyl adenosine modification protein YjeE